MFLEMSMLNVVIIHFLDLLSVKCEVLNQESILRLSSFAVVSYFQSGSLTSPFIVCLFFTMAMSYSSIKWDFNIPIARHAVKPMHRYIYGLLQDTPTHSDLVDVSISPSNLYRPTCFLWRSFRFFVWKLVASNTTSNLWRPIMPLKTQPQMNCRSGASSL